MTDFDLAPYFEAVRQVLLQNQPALNLADALNGNHGDHMVEIFQTVVSALQSNPSADLTGSLKAASLALEKLTTNRSAQIYAQGLAAFSEQFWLHSVSTGDLVNYLRASLQNHPASILTPDNRGEVLKAVAGGLQDWKMADTIPPDNHLVGDRKPHLDLGFLFDLGVHYLQAKQHNPDKLSALAETAISACPLCKVSHRRQSGKLVIQTLLQQILS